MNILSSCIALSSWITLFICIGLLDFIKLLVELFEASMNWVVIVSRQFWDYSCLPWLPGHYGKLTSMRFVVLPIWLQWFNLLIWLILQKRILYIKYLWFDLLYDLFLFNFILIHIYFFLHVVGSNTFHLLKIISVTLLNRKWMHSFLVDAFAEWNSRKNPILYILEFYF